MEINIYENTTKNGNLLFSLQVYPALLEPQVTLEKVRAKPKFELTNRFPSENIQVGYFKGSGNIKIRFIRVRPKQNTYISNR